MKLYSILSALAVCLGLASQEAQAVTCLPNLLPSNPDTAYTLPTADTVTHAPTGLTWKRCSEGQNWSGSSCTGTPGSYTWSQALALGTSSSFAGHSDWRLPSVKELRSLVEECRNNPAINDTIFPGTVSNYFWSSSPQEQVGYLLGNWTWAVDFSIGLDFGVARLANRYPARLVRGGDYFDKFNPPATSLLSISANGTGTGTVSSDASDVNGLGQVSCTSTASSLAGTCLITLPTNSPVTLTAAPAAGGSFSGWSGVCSGPQLTCTISMNAAKAVTAAFSGGTPVPTAPATPTGLAATAGDASANLSFTPASGGGVATSYLASCTAGTSTKTATALSSPIAITGMTNGTSYSCTVLARNSAGNSAPTAAVSVLPVPSTAKPDALTSLVASAGDTSASLAFMPASTGGVATSYLASCTAGTSTKTGTALSSPIAITGMLNGTTYSCTVLARNSVGDSPPSVSVSVTPAAPVAGTGCYPLSNIIESSLANAHSGSVTFTSGGSNAKGGPCYSPTVINNTNWIHLVGQLTPVPDSVTKWIINYTVAANPSATPRIGSLSIGTADVPADIRTYSITQYGPDGMPAPTCTLTASPASITTGASSTLTASCDVAATSFVWSGGNCGNTIGASCTDTPTATTPYTVRGINSTGTGPAAPATVTVLINQGGSIAGTLITRYRLYNALTNEHLYTTDSNEYTVLAAGGGWVGEGAIYRLFQGAGSLSGVAAVPYYRLYNPLTRQHHWTPDLNEYTVLATQGWTQEGIDGYILPTAVAGTLPLYRLFLNASGGLHLWTVDANEKTVLTTTAGWADEGIAGYVIPLQ